jgi:hypothetical protein
MRRQPGTAVHLEERKIGYVLAVSCSAEVPTGAEKFRADALAAKVPRPAWQKLYEDHDLRLEFPHQLIRCALCALLGAELVKVPDRAWQ